MYTLWDATREAVGDVTREDATREAVYALWDATESVCVMTDRVSVF
jgi:hypothetical protein